MTLGSDISAGEDYVRFRASDLALVLSVPMKEFLLFLNSLDEEGAEVGADSVLNHDQVFEAAAHFDNKPIRKWPPKIAPFGALIESFADGHLGGAEFKSIYIRLYKKDDGPWDHDVLGVLQAIFFDSDEYVPEAWLRVGDYIDEETLMQRTVANLELLKSAIGMSSGPGDSAAR